MRNIDFLLDIGSSKITLNACSISKSNPTIFATSSEIYDGFMEGEFLEPNHLVDVIQKLIADLSTKLKTSVKVIHVGVPGEFCVCLCKRTSKKFLSITRITSKIMDEMVDTSDDFSNYVAYNLISYSPMSVVLDGEETNDYLNQRANSITVDTSYILAKKSFTELFENILSKFGIMQINFVSTILGQAMVCAKSLRLDNPFVLVDVGHISTTVAVYKCEGLSLLSSFSLGGGHITADIMELLSKSYEEAEKLKRKVILTLKPSGDEKYIAQLNNKIINARINMTNDIVSSRIESIAQVVKEILDIDYDLRTLPIYITGDGVSNFRGSNELIEKITNHKVSDFTVPFDTSSYKYQTSGLGMAEIVANLIKK